MRIYSFSGFGCYLSRTVAIATLLCFEILKILTSPELKPMHEFLPNLQRWLTLGGSILSLLLLAICQQLLSQLHLNVWVLKILTSLELISTLRIACLHWVRNMSCYLLTLGFESTLFKWSWQSLNEAPSPLSKHLKHVSVLIKIALLKC